MTARNRAGVDVGGTFTDAAVAHRDGIATAKVLTTPAAPERGIVAALAAALQRAGLAFADLSLVIHGTTLATNALIERRGARTALLTTMGFRDTIEMRTESRFDQYDLDITLPAPLVSREHRHPIGGRIAASGRELVPLDETAVERFAAQAGDYDSVAVGFIHSYANPAHELRTRDILAARVPHLSVSLSCEVSPQMREYERFNTVCANAYVKPLMAAYLGRLEGALADEGARCPLFLMHSGGGLMSVEQAIRFPVRLLESGPAGGAIFAADLAARHGLDRVLSFDMGGTTAKICLIEDARPATARTFEVARTARFARGSGMPISIPVIEMVEIGAGGGSVARLDAMRQIRVGPQSAGSEPGPAAYGRGGAEATVTDADVLLGLVDAESFAGGAMPLDAARARGAVEALGTPIGMNATVAATGIREVVDETMANAARVHAVEGGHDLASFTLVAFGGAAPVHAGRLAEKLGIGAVLVPPGAGVGSAIGFLAAPFAYEAVRGAYQRLSAFDAAAMEAVLSELAAEAEAVVRAGAPGAALEARRRAFMRYHGQGWEIPVELPAGPVELDDLAARFEAAYVAFFGRAPEGIDVEVMSVSVRLAAPVAPPSSTRRRLPERRAAPAGRRTMFDPAASGFVEATVVARDALVPGEGVAGPAAITEAETTTIVPAGFTVVAQDDGALLLIRGGGA